MENKELVNYLRERGFRGQGLADALGVTRATVSKAENGFIKNTSMKMLVNAAKELKLEPFELLKEIEKGIRRNQTVQ
jgi:transcriptional regulator with XRE-family HTH domain